MALADPYLRHRLAAALCHHLLAQVPYEEVPHEPVVLPDRVFNPEYERKVLPKELYVPDVY